MAPDQTEPTPLPDYSEDGVDLSLIRWMLSLSPAERLQFLAERVEDILFIRSLNAGNKFSRAPAYLNAE